ncbi:divergent PAP2 family protein [Oscillospiraceae bacterium LTW-04]|nr:divergent PAP2 family protein [Oscillospiraceae bacterium MB24-C1]
MPIIQVLCSNPLVNICAVAWFAAQLIKTLLHWFSHGILRLDRLTGSGGMPSSHSALVVSLTIGMARVEGFVSPVFALTIAFAAVVMYDAMGVRRAAGEQAKTINWLLGSYKDFWDVLKSHPLLDFGDDEEVVAPQENVTEEVNQEENAPADETASEQDRKALKEYLGHTPLEVIAGALLGILIAMIYPL